MFDALINYSLKKRELMVLVLLGLIGSGVYSLLSLPIDAVPDVTNVQVMALTSAPAMGPAEVEQFITIPVENAMNGIPLIKEVRSFSQFGISGVTIIFEDGTDIYWARQQVGERLNLVRSEIPQEFGQPEMGPIATGLGEVYQFEVRNADDSPNPRSLMELRTILDWEVARKLKSVPGVVEVNPLGGELKTYEVELDPNRLHARGIALNQLYEAIRRNNANAGGGYIQRNGELRVIRGVGLIDDLKKLEEVILAATPTGTPIYVRDVGTVRFAPMIRQGAATRDGRGEAVTAIAYLLAGENGRVVVNRIKEKVKEIQKTLPEGVVIDPYYDRSHLIEKTIDTVARNLAEGGVLVIAVLLLLLGNLRAGLIVALAIPLSMLFAGNLMLAFGIAGSLMSLGAIDFGLIVDSAVIVIENCVSRLAHAGPNQRTLDVVRRDTGGAAASRLWRGDHHDGPPADPGVARGRGQDVPADGADGHLRADRLAAALPDGHARPRLVLPQAGVFRARNPPDALGQAGVRADPGSGVAAPGRRQPWGPGRVRRVRAGGAGPRGGVHPPARRGRSRHCPDAAPEQLAQ